MVDLVKIKEQLSSLTLLQAAELVKTLEEEWGVSAAAPVAAAAPAAVAEVAQTKTDFEVVLVSVGDKKIEVIKIVKEFTGLGLKEAKDLVSEAPKTLKSAVKKEDAEKIKESLEAVGAKVELK